MGEGGEKYQGVVSLLKKFDRGDAEMPGICSALESGTATTYQKEVALGEIKLLLDHLRAEGMQQTWRKLDNEGELAAYKQELEAARDLLMQEPERVERMQRPLPEEEN